MKIVCISDTHSQLDKINIPDGDVLVHAGDLTYRGTLSEVSKELILLGKQPHENIILIAGNHDFLFETQLYTARQMCEDNGITYLEDQETVIDGIKFYGSPATPFFHNWAFNYPRGIELEKLWSRISDDTDVLITHGPPRFRLEECPNGSKVGCLDLFNKIQLLNNLKLHVFGHIHDSRGYIKEPNGMYYCNASICDEDYKPVNKPFVFELLDGKISYLSS